MQGGSILGQGENRSPVFLPWRDLCLARCTRMDRGMLHHDNRWTVHGCAQRIAPPEDHFTRNRPCNSVGVSRMPFVPQSSNRATLAGHACARNRVPVCLPGIRDRRHSTKTSGIKSAQVTDPCSIVFDACLERFPLLVRRRRVRPMLPVLAQPTPADFKRCAHPFDGGLAHRQTTAGTHEGTKVVAVCGPQVGPLAPLVLLLRSATRRATWPLPIVEAREASRCPGINPVGPRDPIDLKKMGTLRWCIAVQAESPPMSPLSHAMRLTVCLDPLASRRGLRTSPWDASHRRGTPASVASALKPFLCLAPCLRRSSSHSIRHCANARGGYKNIFVQVLMDNPSKVLLVHH
jgi:hypothetical protein